MISLQSHNQVLFHLTQLTSAVTPRRGGLSVTRSKNCQKENNNNNNNNNNKKQEDVLCYESLVEAANNCTELLPIDGTNVKNLGKDFQVNSNQIFEIISQITRNGKKNYQYRNNNKWKISYISGNSFDDNKRLGGGFAGAAAATTPLYANILSRGFKTKRSIEAELMRNPSISTRFRKWMGLTTPQPLYQIDKGQMAIGVSGDSPQAEKLRSLLNESEMNANEQQRVKVAFAEGYLAGHGQNQPVRAKKWYKVVQQIIIFGIFIGVLISFIASPSGSMFRIQIGNQVEVDPEDIDVTFNDVKGADEAKQELKDVVEFLKSPEKFSVLGGKLPKGVLLVGPPGTGKTLLARAVAGEAGVPFFHAAGPEFDEILVGQGARRVRDLFKAAKERAPCVIFIDEIDSVGAKRTNSVLHPYANQTINQLLSEMDGFHQNEGVIVLGATNRRDDLDTALLRPGRFDVEVTVPTPDFSGRKEILDLYLSRVLSRDIDVEILARGTTGFTGADLENMVNQAALRAAIDGADSVNMKHLENARDKVLMGPERKSRLPDEEANLITAYHEGGHAIVAYFTKDSHPLHKVTIIPRGKSLGHTAYIPEKDMYHTTKQHLLAMMDTMMGGRAAEELIFGPEKITSGASNDLQRATSIAVAMVKEWGMSEKVGLRTHNEGSKSFITVNEVSPNSQELIDSEVKRLMQESYERAKAILKAHSKEHKQLAEALIKYETLDAEDVKAIMTGQTSHDNKTGKKIANDITKNVM